MKLTIEFGSTNIEFEVEYRKRKTLAIEITPPDNILVISPIGLSEDKIKELVKRKGKWIVQKLFEFKEMEYRPFDRGFKNGEAFMYLGRNYSLQMIVDERLKYPEVKLHQGKFYIFTPEKDTFIMRKAMENWYRDKCEKRILDRVNYYKSKIGKEPRIIKVKEQKKRWGSCTSKGDIYFNWRCIMAPSNVFDYIVVHEMCHLIHMDHLKNFWNLVETIIPNYEDRKKWLRNYGVRMDL